MEIVNFFTNILKWCKDMLVKPWFIPLTIVIGGIWALFNWTKANSDKKHSNDLLNQPKFEFYGFLGQKIPSSCDEVNSGPVFPMHCGNEDCELLHWFNVKNTGSFAAKDIRVTICVGGRKIKKSDFKRATFKASFLQSNDSLQVKLDDKAVPLVRDEKGKYTFIVFLDYKSAYSGFKYRRIYRIEASKNESSSCDRGISRSWCNRVEYYAVHEDKYGCKQNHRLLVRAVLFVLRRIRSHQRLEDGWVY